MNINKADIISRLKKEILPLQGFKTGIPLPGLGIDLGDINQSFPNDKFPLQAVHEFICNSSEDIAATNGFITGIISLMMQSNSTCIYLNPDNSLFAPSLKHFGVNPERILFITLDSQKDILWATEEALKCKGITAVISELRDLDFTTSRRLQLAVEQSNVTGFIIRNMPRTLNTNACISRWKITSAISYLPDDMPGVGFPRWNVELLKIRNGKPGSWLLEWNSNRFLPIHHQTAWEQILQKQAG